MSVYAGPNTTESGLVLWLDTANPKSYPGSGTTWTDLSGNGNNGTLFGSPSFSSNNSGSLVFNGSTNNGTIANSASLNVDYITLSIWFKSASIKNSELVMKQNSISTSIVYGIQVWSDGQIYCHGRPGGVWTEISAGSYSANTWYNVALSYDGTNFITYKNGIQSTSTAKTGVLDKNTIDLYIGITGATAINGNISCIQLYNRGLSATEIQQNFNALRGRYGI